MPSGRHEKELFSGAPLDVGGLVDRLEALLRGLPDPIPTLPDLSPRRRRTALERVRAAIRRLQALATELSPQDGVSDLVSSLKSLAEALPELEEAIGSLNAGQRTKRQRELENSIQALVCFVARLDPVAEPDLILDPADPHVIGRLIAKAMLERDRCPLASLEDRRFYGSGVYALYYRGAFKAYQPISGTDHPIYVGKANPKDVYATTARSQGQTLWQRLGRDHLQSITEADNLNPDDFDCRYLVVRSAWQGTAEDHLIRQFKPIWNNETKICFGFGKHGDSAATRRNTVSPWDTLHPGRPWATGGANVPNPKTPADIRREIARHFRENPPVITS